MISDSTITRNDILKHKIASKLKQIRLDKKLTQNQVCNKLGSNQASLSSIEQGRFIISFKSLIPILSVYKVSLSDFFSDINY